MDPGNLATVREALLSVNRDTDVKLLASCVMPDHVHVLFTLGDRLPLGRVLAKVKSLARANGRAEWRWLDDAFERRLRPDEDTEDYGFYVFMNPYQAGLIPPNAPWPGWICPDVKAFRFCAKLRPGGLPQPEWLSIVEVVERRIVVQKRV